MRRALGLVAWAALAAGCPCDPGFPELFYDGFARACDGVPCEWTQVAGAVGSAATIHGGERGMSLAFESAAERDVALTLRSNGGTHALSLLVLCQRDTTLLVTADLRFDDGGATERLLTLTPDETGAGSDRFVSSFLVLGLPDEQRQLTHLDRLRFETLGAGGCVVDELRVVSGEENLCEG